MKDFLDREADLIEIPRPFGLTAERPDFVLFFVERKFFYKKIKKNKKMSQVVDISQFYFEGYELPKPTLTMESPPCLGLFTGGTFTHQELRQIILAYRKNVLEKKTIFYYPRLKFRSVEKHETYGFLMLHYQLSMMHQDGVVYERMYHEVDHWKVPLAS